MDLAVVLKFETMLQRRLPITDLTSYAYLLYVQRPWSVSKYMEYCCFVVSSILHPLHCLTETV